MKIKKFKFKQILKLHLLNSKAYEHLVKKPDSNLLTDFNITQIIGNFKKVLHIIYQFHYAKRRILFIGVPKRLELKINKLTSHLAVPSNFDLQGILLNNLKQLKSAKEANQSLSNLYLRSLLPKLSKRPDLIVLFSCEKKQNIINESYVAKVPVIIFDAENVSNELLAKGSYKVQSIGSDCVSASDKSLFFLGLNFLFKDTQKNLRKTEF